MADQNSYVFANLIFLSFTSIIKLIIILISIVKHSYILTIIIELLIFVKIKTYITWLCFSEENVRDIALRFCLEEEQRRKTNPNETHERSIIIVGSKRVVCSILKILNNINIDYISIFMRKKYIFLG